MKPLVDDVNKIIYKIYKKNNPLLAGVMLHWAKIVGAQYGTQTMPLKITSARDKNQKINILHVISSNSSVALEIAFQQEIIIERLAVYMGYKAIQKIRTVVR